MCVLEGGAEHKGTHIVGRGSVVEVRRDDMMNGKNRGDVRTRWWENTMNKDNNTTDVSWSRRRASQTHAYNDPNEAQKHGEEDNIAQSNKESRSSPSAW